MCETRQGPGLKIRLIATALACAAAATLGAQSGSQPASQADREFVAKVSQGGLYEVEAGKVAAKEGQTPYTRDFGVLETHDHEAVNADLKRIASITGVTIKPGLNAEFSARLAKLRAVPAAGFDAFYNADMKQIHNNDEGLFAKEASEGSIPYKAFAHATAVLVNAHLGWLNTQ